MHNKTINVTFTFTFTFSEIPGSLNNCQLVHDIRTQKVHYFLRDLLLKIISKGSFTEDFYPSQAFSSDKMKNVTSCLIGWFYLC